MGLLGNGWEDPRSAANMGLAMGLLRGDLGGAFGASQDGFMQAQRAQRQGLLDDMRMQEAQTLTQQRQMKMQQEQAEAERVARIRQGIPSLFGQQGGGMTGGQPVPQAEGGIPMFSRPLGVSPMQAAPAGGGFNVQGAIELGMDPEQINAYAGLQNLNRPKATRQMEVDDGKGGKRIALVDDFGQEVAGFAGYTAPVQVNQGDRVSFVRPQPGVSLPVGMSPSERDASARGWAGHGLQQQRLAMDRTQADAGKWQYDAARGGRVNMQSGEFKPAMQNGQPIETKASREAAQADVRQRSSLAQADSVLKEIRDAKGMVGWNTAGVGGAMAVLPSTEARDLSGKLQTVKANLGFDRLQQMRAESPTGGALGGVAIQELVALQATVASLDQLQSPAQLGQALDKIETHYTNWKNIIQQSRAPQGGASGGWGIREKK